VSNICLLRFRLLQCTQYLYTCDKGRCFARVCSSDCVAGQFQSEAIHSQTSCASCAAGQVQPNTGQAACIDCDGGQYQGSSGQTACISCLVGETSSSGASSCNTVECSFGTYLSGNTWCALLSQLFATLGCFLARLTLLMCGVAKLVLQVNTNLAPATRTCPASFVLMGSTRAAQGKHPARAAVVGKLRSRAPQAATSSRATPGSSFLALHGECAACILLPLG
jgi:hypothetical protein